MDLKETFRKKVAELGDKAPEFFGKTETQLATYVKTGSIPLALIQKVFDAQPTTDGKVQTAPDLLQEHDTSLRQIVGFLNQFIVPWFTKAKEEYEKGIEARLSDLDGKVSQLSVNVQSIFQPPAVQGNGAPTIAQVLATDPDRNQPSLVRPQAAYNLGSFTTNPTGEGHPLDTGIAPTREQVEASRRVAEGGIPGQQGKLAGPAVANPEAESFGTPGWTKPWPAK